MSPFVRAIYCDSPYPNWFTLTKTPWSVMLNLMINLVPQTSAEDSKWEHMVA